jgi:hypothetical protein
MFVSTGANSQQALLLLGNISTAAKKIDDLTSQSDILAILSHVYSDIGDKIKDYSMIEKALETSKSIGSEAIRIQEQSYIAQVMNKLGHKVQAINLFNVMDADSKKIKDLSLKTSAVLSMAELLLVVKEREKFNDLILRMIRAIDSAAATQAVKIDCKLKIYRFLIRAKQSQKQADSLLDSVTRLLDDKSAEPQLKLEVIRAIATTFVQIALAGNSSYLAKAVDLVKKYDTVDDVDLVYNDILKEVLNTKDPVWIEKNLQWIIGIIDSMNNQRIKIEILYDFLIKAYENNVVLDPAYVKKLIDAMNTIIKGTRLSPSRYVASQLMKFHVVGIFDSPTKHFEGIEGLLNELLHSNQLIKNLPERVFQVFDSMVDYFMIDKPAKIETLEKAISFLDRYGPREIRSITLRAIVSAMLSDAVKNKNSGAIDRGIELLKKIENKEDIAIITCEIGNAFYAVNNQQRGKEYIARCNKIVNDIADPGTRVRIHVRIAEIMLEKTGNMHGALAKAEEAFQDASNYIVKTTDKIVAMHDIATLTMKIYLRMFGAEEEARRARYKALLAQAKQNIDQHTREGVEAAIANYENALRYTTGTERYGQTWITEQLTKLHKYLGDSSETVPFTSDAIDTSQTDQVLVKQSDISYKQSVLFQKKKELLYQVEVTNNSKAQLTELNCRVKKFSTEYLDPPRMSTIDKTQVLKPGATFTCSFIFTLKRDILPQDTIEAEINFFDVANETTTSIDLDPAKTASGFRFFNPSSANMQKVDKIKARFEKRTHEIAMPFNVHFTWKKMNDVLKQVPFRIVQRDYNEISNRFFGVIIVFAESRITRAPTVIQLTINGDVQGTDSVVKMEIFFGDSIVIPDLVNLFTDQLTIFTCPNPDCNAIIDAKQVLPDKYGVCKKCSHLFFVDADLKKIDKPLKIKPATMEYLLNDEQVVEELGTKIKRLKKEAMDALLAKLTPEVKEKVLPLLDRLNKGELKAKEFLTEAIKVASEKFVISLFLEP